MDPLDAFHSYTEEEDDKNERCYYLDRLESIHFSDEEDAKNSNISEGHAVDNTVESKIDVINLEVLEQIKPEGWTIFEVTGCTLAILLPAFIFYFMWNRYRN